MTAIIRPDQHPLLTNECAFAHVNTTIVSICNGPARNRTVNRDGVRRGVVQLIKDCSLKGGFTGIHVVNNLTFSAYGITGAAWSSGAGTVRRRTTKLLPASTAAGKLAKRDCKLKYDSQARRDCDKVNTLNADGVCEGTFDPNHNCEVFCEPKRTGLYGVEGRPSGKSGERLAPGISTTFMESTEYSVSNGFSIGTEGVHKEAIGAVVSYSCQSILSVPRMIFPLTNLIGLPQGLPQQPRVPPLNELPRTSVMSTDRAGFSFLSCGTIGRKTYRPPSPCMGDICRKQLETGCVGNTETIPDVCSIVPKLNANKEPEVHRAIRTTTNHIAGSTILANCKLSRFRE